MLAKPKEHFGETPCYSFKERLSAEVTRVTPVGNWREKRIRLHLLGEIWGVVDHKCSSSTNSHSYLLGPQVANLLQHSIAQW